MRGVWLTYVVGLGETDKLLDSERVVWVLIWMLLQGKLSVLLLDIPHSRIVRDLQNCKWVESL